MGVREWFDQASRGGRYVVALALLAAAVAGVVSAHRSPLAAQSGLNSAQAPPTSSQKNPSDQLEHSEGVLKPPRDVDPHMPVKPPPTEGGKMPVIPPPGTPGGDPNKVPK
jgi:hypothetical protein